MPKLPLLLTLFLTAATALAQGVPFRLHRYDGFKVHPVDRQSVVFFGNSITNMHEWWEAFGNPHIVNRGVNGAETPIMLDHLETVLAGRPAKLFLMMGTNDLGTPGMNTPAHVARNVREALRRCTAESPHTKVYLQSILPCTTNPSGVKNVGHVPIANDSLKKICSEFPSVTYIDLYDDLRGIADKTVSYDGTHLTMDGYRTWCRKIAPYVSADARCVYPDTATDRHSPGLGATDAMRCTSFAALPIRSTDIVVLGDDGNDWHELLHSPRVKQRGGSWGYQAVGIAAMQAMLPSVFCGRADNEAPQTVCVTLGYKEANSGMDVSEFRTAYTAFLRSLRALVPTSAIKLFAVYPSPSAEVNTLYTRPYNAVLSALADSLEGVSYEEGSYTELEKDGIVNPLYFSNHYLQGRGYAKLSQVFARALGAALRPVSDKQAEAAIRRYERRKAAFQQKNALP